MPCDAIAVAKGRVPLDLARELDGLGTEAVAQALLALLRQRFAHLGQPELTPLWGAHSGARASGIGVRKRYDHNTLGGCIRMRKTEKCVEHQMTEARLARFLAANGLRRDGGRILAPQGEVVGVARQRQDGPTAILVLQESYWNDGCRVAAWWPTFRPAWTLVTGDGEVEVGDPLGPDEVICDLCNADVAIRPVPMVGSYALCAACFARQGMSFPGAIDPYCVLPTREGDEVDR